MADLRPLTRDGAEPNPAGRAGVSAAMRRLLDEGVRFTDVDADLDPEKLRSWTARLRELSSNLADCVEAPARNRVMELLSTSWTEDDANAVRVLRSNLNGASPAQFGEVVGVSGRTIERIESGKACQVRIAHRIATHYALRVSELFDSDHCARTVGELRDAMLTPSSTRYEVLV